MQRRHFLKLAAAAASLRASAPEYEKPLFDLHRHSKTPIRIRSIELLQAGKNYIVRATSVDGVKGYSVGKDPIEDYTPILTRRVAPFFVGKDVRDLETLIDEIYIKNYKLAGQPFWLPVGTVEQALFDLFGKTVNKSVGDLLGGARRKEVPIYLSGSGRETTAEQEVEVYREALARSGANAVKFKIGGRMSRNADAYPGRTEKMIELARKTYGDRCVIYVDANGSYDSKKAIEVGRFLEKLGIAFFEEPCPFEEFLETKRVADSLRIPIAFGECDSSFAKFEWLINNRALDIVQPDLNYNGGFLRTARVARMAAKAGMKITPHNPQTGVEGCNILQFASAIPNCGEYMEWVYRGTDRNESWFSPHLTVKDGKLAVPQGAGLGIAIDESFLRRATAIA
jgi:L-alanine-DL-glutamate epimerase-like enolase superfamily enzyme